MKQRNRWLLVGLWLVLFQVMNLLACNRALPLASLKTKQGIVQRATVQKNDWTVASVGTAFVLGDALRTARLSTAVLDLNDGSLLQVRQNTVIRFSAQRPKAGQHAFDVESGQVLLEAGRTDSFVVTRVGQVRVEAGSKVVIGRAGRQLQFDVTVGKAQLEADGLKHLLAAGQSYVVDVGDAVVEAVDVAGGEPFRGRSESTSTSPASSVQPPVSGVQVRIIGNGVSQKTTSNKDFQKLGPGIVGLLPGTTLRVDQGSRAELGRDGSTLVLSGKGTYVIHSEDSMVEVKSGSLSTTGPTKIVVPGGVIETTRACIASLNTSEKNRSTLRVEYGEANVKSEKDSIRVEQGEEASLNGDGVISLEGRGLAYADFQMDVGSTVTVHDPKPPTATRFAMAPHCPAGGLIRISSGTKRAFASGRIAVSLALDAGRHDYTLYCFGASGSETTPVARGTVTVLRDGGTRPVPSTPPSTSVNIDGRSYTVMYQNQLPNLKVDWPNAPPASSYALVVESKGRTKRLVSASPNYTFKSGTLTEGGHEIHFEGGGKLSRHTVVEIKFDNAAPTASLSTPIEPNVREGGEITIAGVTQPGWSIEIGGVKLEQDGQQRFAQKTTMPTSERALTIKLSHPARGTHVYLRRSARNHD